MKYVDGFKKHRSLRSRLGINSPSYRLMQLLPKAMQELLEIPVTRAEKKNRIG
jgi:hypothetical protein